VTTETDFELSADEIRKIGELEFQAANSGRNSLLEEHSSSFKWLMASLLAINGGGLLGLKDIDESLSVMGLIAGGFFYLGIAGALLVAWLGQRSARALLEPLSELTGFWKAVSVTGYFAEDDHKAILERMKTSIGQAKYPAWAGWVSFASFSLGLLTLGMTLAGAGTK
jgi:hypothetical protein